VSKPQACARPRGRNGVRFGFILPRETGEGDRLQGGGGGSFEVYRPFAPSTMLRMVPLLRCAGRMSGFASLGFRNDGTNF
jgi:hypothetical protein